MAELALESRLAQAVREQEFELHTQPQLALADGALCGVEALLRWLRPERGLLATLFLQVAEARRLILPIGAWLLREALHSAVRWHRAGLLAVPVSVNLSALQIQAADFVAGIGRALAEGVETAGQRAWVLDRGVRSSVSSTPSRCRRIDSRAGCGRGRAYRPGGPISLPSPPCGAAASRES